MALLEPIMLGQALGAPQCASAKREQGEATHAAAPGADVQRHGDTGKLSACCLWAASSSKCCGAEQGSKQGRASPDALAQTKAFPIKNFLKHGLVNLH